MSDSVILEVNKKSINLPLIMGSEGEIGIDISKLRSQTKAITIDPRKTNIPSSKGKL